MRTLKKTLALVLVVAMVFSFGAIGANAAFTDTAASDYTEAIEVLSGIGVINGMTETTFEPTGSLTREQAAKIIAYMLLGTNAQMVSTTTNQRFSDVASTRWSAGYIEYCANLGIIAGVGDDKFDPEGSLTTAAFTKMLLCALGYNATTEGLTGSSWAVNTATLAVGAGITDSTITLSAVTACNREQACQLAYKTLTATTVQYTGGTTITIGGDTIVTGATRSNIPNNSGSGYKALAADNDTYMQFCEAKFSTLKQSTTTLNGTPSYTWKLGATKIGTYGSKTAVASWTEKHSVVAIDTTVAKALSGYSYATTVALYTNGVYSELSKATGTSGTAYDSGDIACLTGNGVKVEVFATGTVIDTVVVTNTVLASIINKDTVNKTVTVSDGTNQVTLKSTSDTDLFGDAYTALYEMNVKDYVLLVETASGNAITSILSYATPTSAVGQYTALSAGAYTIGGTAYKAAATFTPNFTLGSSYTLLLDTYGYMVAQDVNASATVYAYMVQGSRDGSAMAGYTYNAQLVFSDGTMKWVSVAAYNNSTDESVIATGVNTGTKFVSFAEKADGTYALATSGITEDIIANKVITNNNSIFNTSYIVSNSTVFLIYNSTTKTYASYTGIKNVPTTTVTTGLALRNSAGGYSMVVATSSTSSTADVVYIYNDAATSSEYSNGVAAYSYKAIVNGVISTVKYNSATVSAGMKLGSQYTGDVITTLGDDSTVNSLDGIGANKTFNKTDDASKTYEATLGSDNVTLSDGILSVAGINGHSATGIVGDSFVCYVVDSVAETVSVKSLSSTAYSATGTMYFVIDANGYVAYAILVQGTSYSVTAGDVTGTAAAHFSYTVNGTAVSGSTAIGNVLEGSTVTVVVTVDATATPAQTITVAATGVGAIATQETTANTAGTFTFTFTMPASASTVSVAVADA